jgi:hypothetical protein
VSTAIKLHPAARGQDPLTPTPGVDDLALLIPEAEPLSQGLPPVTPALVRRLTSDWTETRRDARCRSGWRITCQLDVAPRPTIEVRWTVDRADRDIIRAWIDSTLEGTRLAFDVAIDDDANTIVVRPLEDAADEWVNKNGYVISMRCEEVFS